MQNATEHDSALEKSDFLLRVTTWMDLEGTWLSFCS